MIDQALAALRRAIAEDPRSRARRRDLARALREAERWGALVEALKEEEAACASAAERVEVLLELATICRDRLRQDVGTLNALRQALAVAPDDLRVLDQLAAHHEATRHWRDLALVLERKAPHLAEAAERKSLYLRVAYLQLERCANPTEATRAFEAALSIDPDCAEALSFLAPAYEKRHDWEKLMALERGAIARLADPEVRLGRGVALARAVGEKVKKASAAVVAWTDVLALDPAHAEALGALEKLHERERQWDRLAEVWARQAELAPDAREQAARLERVAFLWTERARDPHKAIAAWRQVLAVEPERKRAHEALRKLHLAQKEWAELEALYAERGKLDEYVAVLEQQLAHEGEATRIELWTRIGELCRDRLEQPARARAAFEQVLALDPRHLPAAEALIPCYEQDGEDDKLARVLQLQLESTIGQAERQERLARLAWHGERRLGDRPRALGHWLEAFEDAPEEAWLRAELERLAGETGEWARLCDAYLAACARLQPEIRALPLLEVVARVEERELGRGDRALESYRRILALDDQHPEALDALERLYMARADHAEAAGIYARKLEMVTDPAARRRLHYKIARLYEAAGADEAAIDAYRTIVHGKGDEREALAALHRLCLRAEAWSELADVLERELAIVREEAKVVVKFRLAQLREVHLGDVAGAIACHRDVLDREPGHGGARAALERLLGEREHQLAAAAILGPIYERTGEWQRLVDVHQVMAAHAEDPARRIELYHGAARIHEARLGEPAEAFAVLAQALRLDPGHEGSVAELERLAAATDAWAALAQLYKEIASQRLDWRRQIDVRCRLARVLKDRLGEAERAMATYGRVLDLDGGNREAARALDELYRKAGRWGDLAELLRRELDRAATDADRAALEAQVEWAEARIRSEVQRQPDG